MIPLRVEKPVFSPPIVTWLLIAANVAVFVWMRGLGADGFLRAEFEYAVIPRNVLGEDITVLMAGGEPVAALTPDAAPEPYFEDFEPQALKPEETPDGLLWSYFGAPLDEVRQRLPAWLTLFAAMFMHAGWMHLIGNMWFLHMFGSSVEDTLGKATFLAFYLICGLVASAAQLAHDPQSIAPCLGASGAIAGMMGAFAVRFPGAQILTLIPIVFVTISHIPAWIFMLIYMAEQIFMSVVHSADNGGVAWWAHIGGFAGGYLLIRWFPVARAWKEVFSRSRHNPFS